MGQRIRMITVPSAGKALSLGGSEFITSFCFYLCTSITLPETYPIENGDYQFPTFFFFK